LKNKSKRLSVLTLSEQKIIYSLPVLNSEERKYYFYRDETDQEIMKKQIRSLESKIYYILQLVCLKISFRFFKFSFCDVLEDVDYIIKIYFQQKLILILIE
jgi:hypothetical protein